MQEWKHRYCIPVRKMHGSNCANVMISTLFYIATDWKHHAEMGVYAMEHGKHVAIEVPSAMTLDEIWALINTSEKDSQALYAVGKTVYMTSSN